MSDSSRLEASGRRASVADWPGVRTLRSTRFRVVIAGTLLIVSVTLLASLLVRQATDPAGQYGIDFIYWHGAARDVAVGLSPYPARYLEAPVIATDFGYKYPPTFAQALLPLAPLSLMAATHVWALVQTLLAFLAVWLAGLFGGARRSLEHFLWSGVAAAFYLPLWDSIWKGNVSAVQAFQVALLLPAGVVAGVSLASAVLLKTTPLALAPAAVAHGGRLFWGLLASVLAVFALSAALLPDAWLDYLRIQVNLFTGPSVSETNLQPASMAAIAWPDLPIVASALRALTLAVGFAAVVFSVLVARRRGGWPAAVLLAAVVMLAVPGSIWYHYLAILLPPAAYAWPRATARQRLVAFAGATGIVFGLAWLPLAVVGASVLVVGTLNVLLGQLHRGSSATA
jgi:hypothetical protein